MHTLFSVVIVLFRRGSAPKAEVLGELVRGHELPRETFWVLTPKGPLSWVPESFRQDIGKISTWKVFIISIIMITQIYNYGSIFENCDKSLTVDSCMYSADRPMRSAVG